MKLGNFLEPEHKTEDAVHQHYRYDQEIAKNFNRHESSKSQKTSWLSKLTFWK